MAREISKYDDIIDSREVIARIEELEAELEEPDGDYCYGCNLALDPSDPDDPSEVDEAGRAYHLTCKEAGLRYDDGLDDEREELLALKALAEEAEASPDWTYGETLIRDSYFRTYAEELAEDIGAIDHKLNGRWPYTHIDWDAAAEALQSDYLRVDFGDVVYWIRY